MCARGAFHREECAPGAQATCGNGRWDDQSGLAGERLLRLQAGDGLEIAEDRGELVSGPRLAAVAPVLAVGGQAEAAAGLVLVDGEVTRGRVTVAGAALGTEAQTPSGDDDGAAVVPDLAHLEDGRLATPGHGVLPSTSSALRAEPSARDGKCELREVSAGIRWC